MTQSPFFIVGCGRSGTTLLRSMLNQHSQIAIPLESLFIIDYLRAAPDTNFRNLILKEYELREWGLTFKVEDFEGCYSAKDFIDRAHEHYMHHFGKSIWGQKTPRFVRYGELLKQHYPEAKFIHVVRDPRAVVNSLIQSNVHHSNAYYGAHRWLRDVNAGIALQQKYSQDVITIQYESLINSPEESLRQISDFLRIDFEPGLLTYHKTGITEYGKYYGQIHAKLNEAPDPSRIKAWRKYLHPRQIALIESICVDAMNLFGYVPDNNESSINRSYILFLKFQRIFGLGAQLLHNFTTRRGYLNSFMRRKFILSLWVDTLRSINY